MNKNVIWVIALVVVGGGAFWGGMHYQSNLQSGQQASSGTVRLTGGGGGNFAGRNGGAGGRFGGGAGFTAGTILSSGSGSITIQLPASTSTASGSNGSKIIIIDNNTQINKMTSGTMSDLTTGTSVVVSGTPNSDGSLTATMIQIRPTGSGQRGGPGPAQQ